MAHPPEVAKVLPATYFVEPKPLALACHDRREISSAQKYSRPLSGR